MYLPFSAAELIKRCAAAGLLLCFGVAFATPALSENQDPLAKVTALKGMLLQSNDLQTKNLTRHLTAWRYVSIHQRIQQQNQALSSLLDPVNTADLADGEDTNLETVNLGTIEKKPRISLFAVASNAEGDKDATGLEPAYETEGDHYTLGADFRFNEEWLAGIALGNSDSDLDFISQGQPDHDRINAKTDNVSIFASWYRKDFAVDMSMQFNDAELTSKRTLPAGVAYGTTNSQLIGVHLSGTFDFSYNELSYGPLAALDLLDGRIDAYTEQSNAVGYAQIDKQDVRSAILSMGAQAAYPKSFTWGAIVPYVKGICRYQIENDAHRITGQTVASPGSSFLIESDKPDTTWFEFSTGITALLNGGTSLYLSYEAIAEYRATQLDNLRLGLNITF